MKNPYIVLATIAVFLLSASCKKSDSIEGTWILVKGTYITPDNTLNYPVVNEEVHMKILGKSHFATVWKHPTDDHYSGFNGGNYTYQDGVYTEVLWYFMDNKESKGGPNMFKLTFDGDKVYMNSCNEHGEQLEYGYFEEWKIVE